MHVEKPKGNNGFKKKHILIVEDEEPLQELYIEALSRNGHSVEIADNGRIGFRKGVTFNYDIIISDLHMPEWNGADAIKGILLVKPQCPFIVIDRIGTITKNLMQISRLDAYEYIGDTQILSLQNGLE